MENKISQTDLREAISQLELRQKIEGKELKHQLEMTYESVKPVNLIKSTLKEVVNPESLKSNLLNSTLGLAAGMLTRSLFVGVSGGPVRKLVGTVLMFGVTSLVSKRRQVLKLVGSTFLGFIARRRNRAGKGELRTEGGSSEE